MRAPSSLHVKLATEDWEFEAIHRLNYRIFVEEIPQHAPNGDGRLVDRFHAENSYVIAREGDRVLGMLALRGKRARSHSTARWPNWTGICRPDEDPSK
jgi:hypothetical protein